MISEITEVSSGFLDGYSLAAVRMVRLESSTLPDACLRLVVGDESNVAEAEQLIVELNWPAQRVLLMPQARTRAELARRLPVVRQLAEAAGFGSCTRLHVERWDDQRGV